MFARPKTKRRHRGLLLELLEDRTTPTIPTTTTLQIVPDSVAAGEIATFDVTVSEAIPPFPFSYAPFGFVGFFVEGQFVGEVEISPSKDTGFSSEATFDFDTSGFGSGSYFVEAIYKGEPGFQFGGHDPSFSAAKFEIVPPTLSADLEVSSSPALGGSLQVGSTVTFTIGVFDPIPGDDSYAPTGLVEISLAKLSVTADLEPSATDEHRSTATVTINTADIGAGTFTVTAAYLGEDGFATSGGYAPIDPIDIGNLTLTNPPPPPATSPPRPTPPESKLPPPPVPPPEPREPVTKSGTTVRLTAVGSDEGLPATVKVFNADGSLRFEFAPFGLEFTGGVRVAVADVTRDGIPDILTVPGPGNPVRLAVYNGADAERIRDLSIFEDSFRGGAFVSVGDINGDGTPDVSVSPDVSGGPRVDVYDGATFGKMTSFFGIDDPNFRGGARTAIGDFDGDGRGDLNVVAGVGGGPRVAIFTGKSVATGSPARLLNDFFVFEQSLRNGVYVAAGDIAGGRGDELIVGGGPGGGPRVFALDGNALAAGRTDLVIANFFAGPESLRGGVRLAVGDLDGDGRLDIITGVGPGGPADLVAFRADGSEVQSVGAFDDFNGGIFVGGDSGSIRASEVSGGTRPQEFIEVFGQFVPGANTRVAFTDGNGYYAEVPAANVTANSVRVGLPVYINPVTGKPKSANLTASVVQNIAGNDVFSPSFTQTVEGLPTFGSQPGELTESLMRAAYESLSSSVFDLEYAAGFQGDEFNDFDTLFDAYDALYELENLLEAFDFDRYSGFDDVFENFIDPDLYENGAGPFGDDPFATPYDPGLFAGLAPPQFGTPVYTPYSTPDLALADSFFGNITTDTDNVASASAQVLGLYNQTGENAFRDAALSGIGGLPGLLVGLGNAAAIRVGTNRILTENLPQQQVQQLYPQGQLPTGIQPSSSTSTGQSSGSSQLIRTWTGSGVTPGGSRQRQITLQVTPTQARLSISGQIGFLNDIDVGSGTANINLTSDRFVSGSAVGQWQHKLPSLGGGDSEQLVTRQTNAFSAELTSRGLEITIEGATFILQ